MNIKTYNEYPVSVGGRTHLLPCEIVYLVADLNYTVLHLSNGLKIIVSYNLGKLQERLAHHKSFVRVNRGTIVNLDFMSDYTKNHLNIMEHQVVLSRRRRETVLNTIVTLASKKRQSKIKNYNEKTA